MAEVEDRQFNSLAERIAALNQQKNFSSNGKRAPPPPPPGRPKSEAAPTSNGNGNATPPVPAQKNPVIPARPQKKESNPPPSLPRRTTHNADGASDAPPGIRPPPPLLPTRTNTQSSNGSPALPPRRPSTQTLGARRGSNASDMSHISAMSNLSLSRTSTTSTETQPTRKLPPTLDQAKLPPLPPSRKDREAAQEAAQREAAQRDQGAVAPAPMRSIKSAPVVPQTQSEARPSLPPRLPSRPVKSPPQQDNGTAQARRLPPPPSGGFSKPGSTFEPNRSNGRAPDSPPPVPVSSRPSMAQIDAVASRAASAPSVISCLICRDFSRPDAVAAQFPSHSLPRNDPVGYLANVLCGSFPSATDKARAIFTWCHHNVAYNVEEFFGKCIKHRGVEETIFHGKAVCQGYAEVYQAIALRAGLQCVVVGGHGKGYGYTPLKSGERPPRRDPSGHAWNAVMIDNGEWKLLDACWGAGNVGNNTYNKAFKPEMFYLSNELFGLKHFPSDSRHFYRSDRSIPTWEEYMIGPTGGEKALCYSTATDEGISAYTFSPALKHIQVNSNEVVRFQFSKVCEHWVAERHGPGANYLLMMKIRGLDGRKDDLVVLETDGYWWWTDIRARDLGAPGQKIWLYGLNRLNDKDVRGLTKQEYLRTTGSGGYSMSWECYFEWELV
ncbi:hypothetical protein PG999_009070 [Apiospora kogelbergensis]|uniref:Transglutaminase-like domain-containing protein n=1 Tax=Apiospora kogelbergensis TaxID=1337665 RepID=A0AAW0QT77_9PEZI